MVNLNDAYEIAKYIKDAEKQTPVKVYISGNLKIEKNKLSSEDTNGLKAYLKQNFNQNKEYNFQIPEEIKLDMKTKMKLQILMQ